MIKSLWSVYNWSESSVFSSFRTWTLSSISLAASKSTIQSFFVSTWTQIWDDIICFSSSAVFNHLVCFFITAKMIMYEMPWIMNGELFIYLLLTGLWSHVVTMKYHLVFFCMTAAWKIVKTWLGPEAISKLRFVSKSDIQTFIDPEHLPPHMGGTVRNHQNTY